MVGKPPASLAAWLGLVIHPEDLFERAIFLTYRVAMTLMGG
ncbi:hypothetical protein [Brevundimonas sp. AAP58]|nr:hypothetical protein [Brevundimonas sp. AAP58]